MNVTMQDLLTKIGALTVEGDLLRARIAELEAALAEEPEAEGPDRD